MSKILFFLMLICSASLYAVEIDEGKWSAIGRIWYPELSEVLDGFLVKNDTSLFHEIEVAEDRSGSYCFYESEYFMYSLMMALDYGNSHAFYELNRLLHKFYSDNKLEIGGFAIELSTYFQSKGRKFFIDEKNNSYYGIITFETLLLKSKDYKSRDFLDSFLQRVTHKGDSIAYLSLLDTLQSKCSLIENSIHYNYFLNRILFYAIYHIDKSNSNYAYYTLYQRIMEFYALKGKELTEESSRFVLYLLTKAADMGNESAKKILRQCPKNCVKEKTGFSNKNVIFEFGFQI